MNPVDAAILIILAIFILKGVLRGLLSEVCSVLGLVAGGVFAYFGQAVMTGWFQQQLALSGKVAMVASFLLLFVLPFILFSALGFVVSGVTKIKVIGGLDRIAGFWFGCVQGVVFLAVTLFVIQTMVGTNNFLPMKKSQLSPPFVTLGKRILANGSKLSDIQQ